MPAKTKSKSKKKNQKNQKKQAPRKRKQFMVRKRGRKQIPEKLLNVLKPTENDVMKLLAGQVHIGRKKANCNMKRYIWKRRLDGVHVINLEKTWAKIMLAARILVTVKNPADICVMSTRPHGQRGAIKFSHYTKATPIVGKWVPGTFTNPRNERAFKEPRLLIVDDPKTCFAALRETSYMGIPTIGFCGTDCNTRFIDCAIPMNNRGKYAVGLVFYLLAREYKRMKGDIDRNQEWDESVDLFFYRTQEEVLKMQEKEKVKKPDSAIADDDEFAGQFDGGLDDGDYGQHAQQLDDGAAVEEKEDEAGWGDQPPQEFQEAGDDEWGGTGAPAAGGDNNQQGNVEFDTW